jgi:hypothetical protein
VKSARAITHDIIKNLYDSNEAYSMTHSIESISKHGDALNWGNAHTRSMLHFCYLILFWCLLRYDKALSLEFHQVQLRKDDGGNILPRGSAPLPQNPPDRQYVQGLLTAVPVELYTH